MKKNLFGSRRGFTLIEMMISAAIFSVLLVAVLSAFRSGSSGYTRIGSSFNLYQQARLIFKRMDLDIGNAFVYSAEESKFIGENKKIEFFSLVNSFNTKAQARQDVCKVAYVFDLDSGVLSRQVYRGFDALSEEAQPQAQKLASNLEDFGFEYAYPLAADAAEPFGWQDSWPKEGDESAQKTKLPLAVKIKLKLKDKDNSIVEFNKIIPIASADDPDE